MLFKPILHIHLHTPTMKTRDFSKITISTVPGMCVLWNNQIHRINTFQDPSRVRHLLFNCGGFGSLWKLAFVRIFVFSNKSCYIKNFCFPHEKLYRYEFLFSARNLIPLLILVFSIKTHTIMKFCFQHENLYHYDFLFSAWNLVPIWILVFSK